MAHESAVENPADFETKTTCPGCGKNLNLLAPHILAMVKSQRAVIETVDAALVGAETDEDGNITALAVDVTSDSDELDAGRDRYYLGYKKGAGEQSAFHNYDCLAEYATKRAGSSKHQDGSSGLPKLRIQLTDPEAEGRSNE